MAHIALYGWHSGLHTHRGWRHCAHAWDGALGLQRHEWVSTRTEVNTALPCRATTIRLPDSSHKLINNHPTLQKHAFNLHLLLLLLLDACVAALPNLTKTNVLYCFSVVIWWVHNLILDKTAFPVWCWWVSSAAINGCYYDSFSSFALVVSCFYIWASWQSLCCSVTVGLVEYCRVPLWYHLLQHQEATHLARLYLLQILAKHALRTNSLKCWQGTTDCISAGASLISLCIMWSLFRVTFHRFLWGWLTCNIESSNLPTVIIIRTGDDVNKTFFFYWI